MSSDSVPNRVTMAKNTLVFAILNLVAFLNVPLIAQQSPGENPGFKRQHSILQRVGEPTKSEPTPPAARIAEAPQFRPPNRLPIEIKTPTTPVRKAKNPKINRQLAFRNIANKKATIVKLSDESESAQAFELSFNGPEEIESGEVQVFNFKVTNLQKTRSAPVVMQLGMPSGIKFVDSTIQARVDLQRSVTEWMVRPLAPGETVEVNFRARGIESGNQRQQLAIVQNRETIENTTLDSFVNEKQLVRARIVANSEAVTVGHPSQVEVELTNLTQEIKRGLEVQVELPADVEVVESVLYDVQENVVTFRPIDIRENQTRSVSLTLVGQKEGDSQMSAVVVSETQPISNKENAMLRFSRVASLHWNNPTRRR